MVLLHSSRSRVGFVAGGRQAIVQALLDVVGEQGTLVVPTHTSDNTDPATWQHPPVPESWWPVIREQSPGFDPARTPASRWMGILPETIRTWPGAVRSDHPQVSFAAIGAQAEAVTQGHRRDDALGDSSPLGAVYRLDGQDPDARRRLRHQHLPAPGRVATAGSTASGHRVLGAPGRTDRRAG